MTTKLTKKKQPEVVRYNLLEATAALVAEVGFAGATLDQVAQKAGVSKGGLLHHFPSKQALFSALEKEILDEFEKMLDDFIAADPEPRGRFVRSYIKTRFTPLKAMDTVKLFRAFAMEIPHDESMAQNCREWFIGLMTKHGEDSPSTEARLLCFAADGIWMEDCTGMTSVTLEERRAVIDFIIERTYEL